MTLRILCDIDGVVADFVSAACHTIDPNGDAYVPEDFKHWDMSKTLTIAAQDILDVATCEQHWCYRIPEYQGSRNFMKRLKELGDVRALTAAVGNSKHWINERKAWLYECSGIVEKHIVFCPGEEKQFHSGDVLIEDRLETCVQWAARWRDPKDTGYDGGRAILIDRPWNRGPCTPGVFRAYNYDAALLMIKGMT